MSSVNLTKIETFEATLPKAVKDNIFATEGEKSKWGRLLLTWNEQTADGVKKHEYAAGYNRETGDVYLDCRPRKILAKCALTSLVHIPFAVARIGADIANTCGTIHKDVHDKNLSLKSKAWSIIKGTGKILFDTFIKNPALSVVLAVISAVGAVIGALAAIFKSQRLWITLYDIRELSGSIEKHTGLALAPCFQPQMSTDPKETAGQVSFYKSKDWFNTPEMVAACGQDETMRMLNNWGGGQLRFRRSNRAIFNDCCTLMSKSLNYISEACKDMRAAGAEQTKRLNSLRVDPVSHKVLTAKINTWMGL